MQSWDQLGCSLLNILKQARVLSRMTYSDITISGSTFGTSLDAQTVKMWLAELRLPSVSAAWTDLSEQLRLAPTVAAGGTIVLVWYVISRWRQRAQYPPGPMPLPLIGNVHSKFIPWFCTSRGGRMSKSARLPFWEIGEFEGRGFESGPHF